MLLFPEDIRTAFEFDKIVERLGELCQSAMGKQLVADIRIMQDLTAIRRELEETEEFRRIVFFDRPFPYETYPDISHELSQLEIEETYLSAEGFTKVRKLLLAYKAVATYLRKNQVDYPRLEEIIADLPYEKSIVQAIDKIFDQEGRIKSNASPELVRIRRKMDSARREITKAFNASIAKWRKAGVLTDSAESIRNGRRVLSVTAESKRRITGIIHDESDTGKTVFIEPEETVFLNNSLAELDREEHREIIRLLKELTRNLVPHAYLLEAIGEKLGWLDFTHAKAKFAVQLDAHIPQLSAAPHIKLSHARHPLLYLLNEANKKETVPLDVELDSKNHILLISGPNAGGKSVCLKTLGLLQLMLQAGLLVPVDPQRSSFGIFNQIFGDIGDTQSLEDELSTYSSRLYRMRFFMEHADRKTLFLIDEFGSGTDPQLGGAIAEAILDELRRKKAFGLITTHYANLKIYADNEDGVINGSMAFDERELVPLFRLDVGQPGSSYTFDIARKIPLPDKVIQKAESLVDVQNLEFENLLSKVQGDQQELARKFLTLEQKEQQLRQTKEAYDSERREIKDKERKTSLRSKEQQERRIEKLEAEVKRLLEALEKKKKPPKPEEVKKIQETVQKEQKVMRNQIRNLKKAIHYKDVSGEIAVGTYVRLIEGDQVGEVIEVRGKICVVAFGHLRTTVKKKDLLLVEKKQRLSAPKRSNRPTDNGNFDPVLDIRGKTREEGLEALEKFMDQALLKDLLSVRIIHGKGTGVLREAVKRELRKISSIKEVKHEDPKHGGDGVTIATFI